MFHSQTFGDLTLEEVRNKVFDYIRADPEKNYRLVIGTDSASGTKEETDFVTAIVIHRVGRGGIYFWQRTIDKKKYVLRERIYQEAFLSLKTAQEFMDIIKVNGIGKYDVEIHVDIGPYGETREMINEVVGMVRGSGFAVAIKPEAYGASKVADRHT